MRVKDFVKQLSHYRNVFEVYYNGDYVGIWRNKTRFANVYRNCKVRVIERKYKTSSKGNMMRYLKVEVYF